jgi:predicted adenylyl cyclase CyaB
MTVTLGLPPEPRRNIELKARLASLTAARGVAQRLATGRLADQRQVDTYFVCRRGRLKLREVVGQQAQLIWYERPDEDGPKLCQYRLIPIDQPAALKEALSAALGVRVMVDKYREIYLYHNVRIHLDRVAGLGTYLEFEAVLDSTADAETSQAHLAYLRQQFSIADQDLIEGSYADLSGLRPTNK